MRRRWWRRQRPPTPLHRGVRILVYPRDYAGPAIIDATSDDLYFVATFSGAGAVDLMADVIDPARWVIECRPVMLADAE